MVFNHFILALEAPVDANTRSALRTSEKNIEGSSSQKKKHKNVETNIVKEKKRIVNEKKRKHSLDKNVSLALKVSSDANMESAVRTSEKNTEGSSSQKKKRKKKSRADVESITLAQKLPKVGINGEQGLKEVEHMEMKIETDEKRKQSLDENLEVSNTVDILPGALYNRNTDTAVHLQTTEKNIEGGSTLKKKKKNKLKAEENKSPVQKFPEVGNLGEHGQQELVGTEINREKEKSRRQSVDENFVVSNSDDIALKKLVDGNMEMCLEAEDNYIGEGSGEKKKRKKKKHVAENYSPVKKLLEDGSMGDQDKKEPDGMEIDIVKEKNRKESVDENLEVPDIGYLSPKSPLYQRRETTLQTAENCSGRSSGRDKKRKKKKCKAKENDGPPQKLLENGEKNIEKDKKRMHTLDENINSCNADDLSLGSPLIGNVKTASQTTEKSSGGSSSWKKKRKENNCKSVENNSHAKQLVFGSQQCEQDGKKLKDVEINVDKELKMKESFNESKMISEVEDLAMESPVRNIGVDVQTTVNNSEESSRKKPKKTRKKECKVVENNVSIRELLESGNMCPQEIKNVKHPEIPNHETSMGNSLIIEGAESDANLKKNYKLAETNSIINGREKKRMRKWKKLSCSSAKSTGPAYMMQTVQNSSVGVVSVSCSDNLVSSKRKLGDKRGDRATGDELNDAQKSVGEHGISEGRSLEELPNMSHGCSERKLDVDILAGAKQTEELNEIQKIVQDHDFSGKQSVGNFLTCADKVEKCSLETGNDLDSAAYILLNLRHGKCDSPESSKGGCSQFVEKIPVGESSAQCEYKNPTPGKRVRKKKKVSQALLDSTSNAIPKQQEQENEIKNELVQLDEVTEVCHVLSEGNLEVTADELKRGELLSPCGTRKKLLILDLNGLLADIVSDAPIGFKVDKKIARKSLFKRTHCDEFLKFCFERFEVGVWSSRNKKNVATVVDFLMKDMKRKLLFCWDQSHCTETGFRTIENNYKPLVLKELKKLWDKHDPNLPWQKGEYNETNTLLVDDSPYKALCNPPHTAIFPDPYRFQDTEDNSLGIGGNLRLYLEGLSLAEDVQKYVKEHPFGQSAITCENPSWSFYSKILDAKISEDSEPQKESCTGSPLNSSLELFQTKSGMMLTRSRIQLDFALIEDHTVALLVNIAVMLVPSVAVSVAACIPKPSQASSLFFFYVAFAPINVRVCSGQIFKFWFCSFQFFWLVHNPELILINVPPLIPL